MQHENRAKKDPVCGMMVDTPNHVVDYQGIRFFFCSEQCKERFIANPHLYVGSPGHSAPKQEGKEVIKKRRLHLVQPLSWQDAEILTAALREMMGVKAVIAQGDRVEITYDLLQATAEQIEVKLSEIGAMLGEGWTERLRRAFIHYEEECTVENLEAQKSHIPH